MAIALETDIQANGMNQGDIYSFLSNTVDVVNEMQTDHGTFSTVIGDLKTLLNQLRQNSLYQALGNPGFAISTNFDVKNANAISYLNGGTLKTLTANTNFDTGASKTIPTTKWGAALLSVDSSGTAVLTWASSTYNSEALAIAALAAPASTNTVLGYVTVQAAGSTWTAGTDALASGTGGTPANATNYYNSINPNTLMIGSAVSSSAPDALTNSTALTLSAS